MKEKNCDAPGFLLTKSILICIVFSWDVLSRTSLPAISLDSAVTRDADGNGYLDQIELYFNAPVSFPAGFPLTGFTVIYSGTVDVPFTVDSMAAMDTSGARYVLYLVENSTSLPESPQTAWRPDVTVNGLANAVFTIRCKDGAGPVIWKIENYISDIHDLSRDFFRIIFSEPVQGSNGSALSPAGINPSMAFRAFRPRGTGYDTLRTFAYIDTVSRIVNDSTIELQMSFRYFDNTYYVNINSSTNQIYDRHSGAGRGNGVPAAGENRKALVTVFSSASPSDFSIFLDPCKPTVAREEAGRFYLRNNEWAGDWVRTDFAGVSFTFDAIISREDSTEVSFKIFDTYGSEVATAVPDKTSYLRDIDTNFNTITYVSFYWNGTTTHSPSTYVHEGIYTAELKFQRKNEKDPIVYTQAFYMEKPDSGHSTCGGNYSIAFVPALLLKSRKPLIRIFRKTMRGAR